MMLALGNVHLAPLLREMKKIALDQSSDHEFNVEHGRGSWSHADGWGLAYLQQGEWVVEKSLQPFFSDPRIEQEPFRMIQTTAALIHVRKKAGSGLALENTHPFIVRTETLGEVVFCHNGCIEDEISFSPEFRPQGQTDSEKWLYAILTELKGSTMVKAIRENFRRLRNFTGTNIILAGEKKFYAGMSQNRYPRYYQLLLGQRKDLLVVSSERLDSLPGMTWTTLTEGDVVEIDHRTRQYTIHAAERRELMEPLYVESAKGPARALYPC